MDARPPMTDLATISKTLRFVASWIVPPDDVHDQLNHYVQTSHLIRAAKAIEGGRTSDLDVTCPLCQEVACDEGCPMAPHRWDYYTDPS